MLGLIFPIVAIVLIGYLLYKKSTSNYDYFEKAGLPYAKPFPLLGINSFMFKSKKNMSDVVLEMYNDHKTSKVFGAFDFSTPIFVLRDLDLVKQLTIKDFPHFQDHRAFVDSKTDDFFGNMLFAMKGKQWRDMRSSLSPLFTGRKMRLMFQLISLCSNQLTDYIKDELQMNKRDTFKMKDFFSKFTNDVIASCAFGVECNSLKNPKDEFYSVAQELLSFQKTMQLLKFTFIRFAPKLSRAMGLTLFSPKVKSLFYKVIIQTMETRKEQGIDRPDMINLLMSLKDGDFSSVYSEENSDVKAEQKIIDGEIKHNWTDTELIAQCFIFFIAGFDTSSSVMQFLAYELATHQEIQDKLYEEIKETNEKLEGKPLTYDALKTMSYMSMVINEALRKWPPVLALDRLCVKDYKYEDDEVKFEVKEGDMLWIPVYAFHMDPKYFPNPEKFDPERFSEGNNANMDAFLPFGVGPRNCIGFRFALMETKSMLYYLLLKYKLNVCKETQIPLQFKKSFFGFIPQKEITLRFEARDSKKNN